MKRIIQTIANKLGYQIERIKIDPLIKEDLLFMKIYEKCKNYTMTSAENMYQLYLSIKYIIKKGVKGDIVECGIWKGGSVMVIALTLLELGINNKKIYLYDTFEGMSEPTEKDITINREPGKKSDECLSPIEEVKNNLRKTDYPLDNFIFVKGKVEDTIPKSIPKKICLLRLDTDWFESTKHELQYLYPLLEKEGVLIVDDYGIWLGAKKAVDDYFKDKPVLLNRIDKTARLIIK